MSDEYYTVGEVLNHWIAMNNDGPLVACTLSAKQLAAPSLAKRSEYSTGRHPPDSWLSPDGKYELRFLGWEYSTDEDSAFTAWTETRVYFPATYDGGSWIDSVPRHPCDEATKPVGGG
jgi:hypothetical protein